MLLLLAAGCFHSCQQEDIEMTTPDTLLSRGRYLGARNGDSATALEKNDTTQFPVNTPYRLLAFTKPYYKTGVNDETAARYPRFNKVAWEGATPDDLHYINLADANRWFGFAAFDGEPAGEDKLVSLDFYGFTYGKAEDHSTGYIELDGVSGETTPAQGALSTLKHTESVGKEDGKLKDLLYSKLLNRNIGNAGLTAATAAQSIMYFRHCFSQLIFCVAQQYKEGVDEKGDPVIAPYFPGLEVENVEVTNTYGEGSVYLEDGKVDLSGDPITRQLRFADKYKQEHNGVVTTEEVEMGRMIVFPSHGSALREEENKPDGYKVGLRIAIKSPNKEDIANFLTKTGSPGEITGETVDGTTYYKGTIVMPHIIDHIPDGTSTPETGNAETGSSEKYLYFKQHTRYRLVILFSKEFVRIITVIPQVEEWLPGEGTSENPWQEQPMGQPEMFDNIVWSDRNLGADHYDPLGDDFEKTIGYFYQSGRNIPYYPFDSELYYDKNTGVLTSHPEPTPEAKKESRLSNVKPYYSTRHRFYPMVDPEILSMKNQMSGWGTQNGSSGSDRTWMITSGDTPQMDIPETKPTNAFFDFMRSAGDKDSGLKNYNKRWNEDPKNQPVSGGWVVPTSSQFMAIFPSTPHAGNITFRAGGNNKDPMGWGGNPNEIADTYKTLRVTVPYYYDKMGSPHRNNASENYLKAWNTLKDNEDPGTTQYEAYSEDWVSPGSWNNVGVEPDGDPEDGFASVYVISRNEESKFGLPLELQNEADKKRFCIQSWGTIYAIKRVYTEQAYRMRWRVKCAGVFGTERTPGLYVEVCRYRYNTDSGKKLTEENYLTDFDWDHPAATLYFPICGLGDWTGNYINFGTECQYATSDPIESNGTWTSALQIKITGDNAYNAYMAVISGPYVNRDFGKQIRPIMVGANDRK